MLGCSILVISNIHCRGGWQHYINLKLYEAIKQEINGRHLLFVIGELIILENVCVMNCKQVQDTLEYLHF